MNADTAVQIDRLDHLVLTVANVDATCAFYERVLGMTSVTYAGCRRALTFGAQKINLHQAEREIEPRALEPTPGSADLCFIVQGPLDAVAAHLDACEVEVEEGPVLRHGAVGPMTSLYLRDPDGNLIELSTYD